VRGDDHPTSRSICLERLELGSALLRDDNDDDDDAAIMNGIVTMSGIDSSRIMVDILLLRTVLVRDIGLYICVVIVGSGDTFVGFIVVVVTIGMMMVVEVVMVVLMVIGRLLII